MGQKQKIRDLRKWRFGATLLKFVQQKKKKKKKKNSHCWSLFATDKSLIVIFSKNNNCKVCSAKELFWQIAAQVESYCTSHGHTAYYTTVITNWHNEHTHARTGGSIHGSLALGQE